jgi:hypothetical protein
MPAHHHLDPGDADGIIMRKQALIRLRWVLRDLRAETPTRHRAVYAVQAGAAAIALSVLATLILDGAWWLYLALALLIMGVAPVVWLSAARLHARVRVPHLEAALPEGVDVETANLKRLAYRHGWRPSHMRMLDSVVRSSDPDEAAIVWHYALKVIAETGWLPGLVPEHQIAWIAVIMHPQSAVWHTVDGAALHGPSEWSQAHSLGSRGWVQGLGPRLAPLAAAADLGYVEAREMAARGALDERGLRTLAGLRGMWLPDYPHHPRPALRLTQRMRRVYSGS